MMFSPQDCPPTLTDGTGYVYVLAFSNSTIKVGMTTSPKTRLTVHVYNSSRFGVALTDWWLSPAHSGYQFTERAVIALAQALSPTGRAMKKTHEYFEGVDFAKLVELCGELELGEGTGPFVNSLRANGLRRRTAGYQVVRHEEPALPASRPTGSPSQFGRLIADARTARGLSQDQVAQATGVSRASLTRWENGKTDNPGSEQVRVLCLYLGIPLLEAVIALGYLAEADLTGVTP